MVKVLGLCINTGEISQLQLGTKYWLRKLSDGGEHYYVSHHHIQNEGAYFAIARGCHFEIVEEVVEEVPEEHHEFEQLSLF